MSIRLASIVRAEPSVHRRAHEPKSTRPAPLSPPVLQHGRAPQQLSFFFKRA